MSVVGARENSFYSVKAQVKAGCPGGVVDIENCAQREESGATTGRKRTRSLSPESQRNNSQRVEKRVDQSPPEHSMSIPIANEFASLPLFAPGGEVFSSPVVVEIPREPDAGSRHDERTRPDALVFVGGRDDTFRCFELRFAQ